MRWSRRGLSFTLLQAQEDRGAEDGCGAGGCGNEHSAGGPRGVSGEGPACRSCAVITVRNGARWVCVNCGWWCERPVEAERGRVHAPGCGVVIAWAPVAVPWTPPTMEEIAARLHRDGARWAAERGMDPRAHIDRVRFEREEMCGFVGPGVCPACGRPRGLGRARCVDCEARLKAVLGGDRPLRLEDSPPPLPPHVGPGEGGDVADASALEPRPSDVPLCHSAASSGTPSAMTGVGPWRLCFRYAAGYLGRPGRGWMASRARPLATREAAIAAAEEAMMLGSGVMVFGACDSYGVVIWCGDFAADRGCLVEWLAGKADAAGEGPRVEGRGMSGAEGGGA